MATRIVRSKFKRFRSILIAVSIGAMIANAAAAEGTRYRNDQFHYSFTIPKGWELQGDNLRNIMNTNNQARGLPQIDTLLLPTNDTSELPVVIEIHVAKPIESGGFEAYVNEAKRVEGLSPQQVSREIEEQIKKSELKELARAMAGFRLVRVDQTFWRFLTEMEQCDLGYKILAATCFGNNVTVEVVYRAPPKLFFSEHHSGFSSLVESLTFDQGYQYNPKDHSTTIPRITMRRGAEWLERLTSPACLLFIFLLVVAWMSTRRRRARSVTKNQEDT
ncbi:MAG: hypothetical protein ABFD60_09915 [Bryobacteraceae bacterium]